MLSLCGFISYLLLMWFKFLGLIVYLILNLIVYYMHGV